MAQVVLRPNQRWGRFLAGLLNKLSKVKQSHSFIEQLAFQLLSRMVEGENLGLTFAYLNSSCGWSEASPGFAKHSNR